MKITVLMASGDEDEWTGNAADAVDDRGALVILGVIEGDEAPGDMKTLEVKKTTAGGGEKKETFQVHCVYAPGMWMKVEFE